MLSRIDWQLVTVIALIVFMVALIGGTIALYIYVWTNYANTPVSELPAWVAWVMWGR